MVPRTQETKREFSHTDLGLQFPVAKSIIISCSLAPCGRPLPGRRVQAKGGHKDPPLLQQNRKHQP